MVILLVLCILVLLVIAASYVCCRFCFFVPKQTEEDLFRLPDTEQYAPHREAMTQMVRTVLAHCDIPVLLIHGGDDRFVPCDMGRENYAHCAARNKHLLVVPGAGHGLSYMVDREAYLAALESFLRSVLD